MANLVALLASLTCTYSFPNVPVPMTTVEVSFGTDGKPMSPAKVTMQGRMHTESFTQEEAAAGEMLHGWLSKESSENSIELVVFDEPQAQGRSKLVNDRFPIGKEMWGDCEIKSR